MESSRTPMNSQPPKGPPGGPSDPGSPQRAKRLGDQLRRMYDSVANEGTPDDFLKLLNDADLKRDGDEPSSKED